MHMSESKNLDDQANQSPLNKEKDEVDKKNNDESETRLMVLYNFGPLADQMSHQAFQFLIFVFYYSVVGINVQAIMWSFVLFTVWDSINDPLLGPISDRTESKLGRRRFWVLVSLVPFSLINWLLFTPPGYGQSDTSNIIYMIIIIMLYDLFYTMFSIQEFAIFPEMFPNKKKRERAATIKAVMTIVGIIIGFVLPTFLIVPLVPTEDSPEEYIR